MNKPNARELLKECRAALLRTELAGCLVMADRIDAYLAAPSESAMETVRKIRETEFITDVYGNIVGTKPILSDSDAAALIEGLQRRVPRKMLNDIMAEYKICKEAGYSDLIYLARVNGIVAKHGVVIEEGQ